MNIFTLVCGVGLLVGTAFESGKSVNQMEERIKEWKEIDKKEGKFQEYKQPEIMDDLIGNFLFWIGLILFIGSFFVDL